MNYIWRRWYEINLFLLLILFRNTCPPSNVNSKQENDGHINCFTSLTFVCQKKCTCCANMEGLSKSIWTSMDMPAQRKVEALANQRRQTKPSDARPDSSRLEGPWVRKVLLHNQQLVNSESETPRFDYWSKNGSCFFFLTLGEDMTFWTEKKKSYNYYLDKDFFW